MVFFWYIFIPKMEHFLPGAGTKISILTAGYFFAPKRQLYNKHNKCPVFIYLLCKMHIPLFSKHHSVTKWTYKNITRGNPHKLRLLPHSVTESMPKSHGSVTMLLSLLLYAILTIQQRKPS